MTKYDKIISTERRGVCKRVVEQQERRLEKLWEKTESKGKEMVMGFAILDGNVEVSVPIEGGSREVQESTVMDAIGASHKYDIEQYDMLGHIHTHPVGSDTMPNVMSPSDHNIHIKMSDRIEQYDTSLVLTRYNQTNTLFGITTDNTPRNLGDIQGELAKKRSNFMNHQKLGKNPFEILAEIEDLMLEHWEPCSYKF